MVKQPETLKTYEDKKYYVNMLTNMKVYNAVIVNLLRNILFYKVKRTTSFFKYEIMPILFPWKKYPTNKIEVYYIDDKWSIDLLHWKIMDQKKVKDIFQN